MNIIERFFTQSYLYLIIALIGVCLKFYKLNDQFYWDDEIATITHTTGIPMGEFGEQIPINKITSKQDYLSILDINDKDYNLFDQIVGLSKMPQLTPGHYYYLIFWTKLFGDSTTSFRMFSVFIFLITLPILFLLSRKLFKSSLSGYIAMAIFSVSPLFQHYAQEARYVILWFFSIALLHYLFLKATEKQQTKWWVFYSVAAFLAIHVSILNCLILGFHFLYFVVFIKDNYKPFLIALSVAFLFSLPFLILVFSNFENIKTALSWHASGGFGEHSFTRLLNAQWYNINEMLVNLSKENGLLLPISKWFSGIVIVVSLILFVLKAPNRKKLFVLLFLVMGVLFFIASDMIRQGFTSFLTRYLVLFYSAVFLILAFSFSYLIKKKPLIFGTLFLVFICFGLMSSKNIVEKPCFEKRDDCYDHFEDSNDYLNGDEKILIITDFQLIGGGSYTTMLSYLKITKNPNIDILLAKKEFPDFRAKINSKSYDEVYAQYLSDDLRNELLNTFNENEITLLKDRKLYNFFYLPVFSIQPE